MVARIIFDLIKGCFCVLVLGSSNFFNVSAGVFFGGSTTCAIASGCKRPPDRARQIHKENILFIRAVGEIGKIV